MTDFNTIRQFNFPTTIRFGAGVINELKFYLKENNLATPLIVTDPNVAQLDFFKNIIIDLSAAGIATPVYTEMHKNPIKSDVENGAETFRNENCDAIIGIGGGVAMDVARAIALAVNNREDLFKYDDLVGGDQYITEPIPHFITVPTTSGTGSEVGRSAIISENKTKQKKILFHPTLLAKIVFADPLLTMQLPSFITAATGMDALTHNMEAYMAKGYHPMCDGIALEGIRMIFESIETATLKPTLESRSQMLLASLMGAVAFQKGLGIVHSLAHPLSSLLDTHHGLANAVNLPYGMEFNYDGFESRFDQMALAMGLGPDKGTEVIGALFDLNDKLGLPKKLSALDVKQEHIEELSILAEADFCHPNNPKPVSKSDFKNLYEKGL
jgi:alcohol dehydrogenase class IV